jgi:hypothetical protein
MKNNTKINYLSLLMISGLILSSTNQAMDVNTSATIEISALASAAIFNNPDLMVKLIKEGADVLQAFIDLGKLDDYEAGTRLIDTILKNQDAFKNLHAKAITTFVGIGTKRQSPYLQGQDKNIPILIGKTMKGPTKPINKRELLRLLSPNMLFKKISNFDQKSRMNVLQNAGGWNAYIYQNFKETK